MSELDEKLSLSIKKATDILLVMNPIGTSMGFFGGIVLHGFFKALSIFFDPFKGIIKIEMYYYIILGIFTFNIRQFYRKDKVPLELIEKVKFIEEMEKSGKITKLEAKMRYRQILSEVIKSVQFDASTEKDMKKINEINQNIK